MNDNDPNISADYLMKHHRDDLVKLWLMKYYGDNPEMRQTMLFLMALIAYGMEAPKVAVYSN